MYSEKGSQQNKIPVFLSLGGLLHTHTRAVSITSLNPLSKAALKVSRSLASRHTSLGALRKCEHYYSSVAYNIRAKFKSSDTLGEKAAAARVLIVEFVIDIAENSNNSRDNACTYTYCKLQSRDSSPAIYRYIYTRLQLGFEWREMR